MSTNTELQLLQDELNATRQTLRQSTVMLNKLTRTTTELTATLQLLVESYQAGDHRLVMQQLGQIAQRQQRVVSAICLH